MDENKVETKVVKPNEIQQLNNNQPSFPTWSLLIALIFAFIILKTFIYIKDEKRHGR